MTRAALLYDRTHAFAPATGHDVDLPVAGLYRMRLRSGGVAVGVRIWHGPPLDPVTGETMDRSWRWQAAVNGAPIDIERVWPACADDPIDQSEHDHLAGLQAWGRAAGHAAIADPTRRLDPLSSPILF